MASDQGEEINPRFKLGSIIYYDFGPPAEDRSHEDLLREKHYAVVVQTDLLSGNDKYTTLAVAGMTSTKPYNRAGWVEIPATTDNGLDHIGYCDAKKLYTIRKDRVARVVGNLEKNKVYELKRILAELFELNAVL
ncbi:type II toxin-antitoxin system PemK/MazF family toxin [Fimbriimonas ginsengisoli]|uniref:PemK family protein n=1 Tax=Fimbriimonas ginsengisoli Gsoil 348 TaxID=661478 RepID=A0A068NVU6_FIMGI|nr:type II toxin-antitoxin system PemK/MazF family toxin [Fimbriimonas ginsengisoli]AIE87487.1 PemK family protein [Fimbriimonas ginsengisoli Gsoil 348]